MIAVAAASGAMAVALPASAVFAADADGAAAGSPGLASGNSIQIPVNVPVNVCGNTVDVVGLLNPAAGNMCANKVEAKADGAEDRDGAAASGGASADGRATDSPGLLSGNSVHLPVDVPVNVTGNSVNAVGVGNPVFDNESVNGPVDHHDVVRHTAPKPPAAHTRSRPGPHTAHAATPALARTGTDLTAPLVAGSAAFLLTGAILYRRFHPARTH
ncbi:chaplin [Streptomyces sp. NPDC048521]|uniref:chaplin n=1 Tax=Streptomyces sp. NPDC048521 TaxID=3365566 RepID=UPI00371DA68E